MGWPISLGTRRLRAVAAALWPVGLTCAWLAAAAVTVLAAPAAFVDHPRLARLVIYAIAIVGALGGLVGYWYSASAIQFLACGYQVSRLEDAGCAYLERRPDGTIERLRIEYRPLADGYRPACEVTVPSALTWDSVTPAWAHGRREEILRRIARGLGADAGTEVRFTSDLAD